MSALSEEERGAERDRPGGDADRLRACAIRAAGVVVEQHLVDDVEVALAPVWKSNFGRPTPSTRRRPRNCICSMA